MNDEQVLSQIQSLVDEEHELLQKTAAADVPEADRNRLKSLEVRLDQCWDLLRQRRARREFGEDPGDAQVRDGSTVERYQQ